MKLTLKQLKRIIKEELNKTMNEGEDKTYHKISDRSGPGWVREGGWYSSAPAPRQFPPVNTGAKREERKEEVDALFVKFVENHIDKGGSIEGLGSGRFNFHGLGKYTKGLGDYDKKQSADSHAFEYYEQLKGLNK
jgi:hypothetical protein